MFREKFHQNWFSSGSNEIFARDSCNFLAVEFLFKFRKNSSIYWDTFVCSNLTELRNSALFESFTFKRNENNRVVLEARQNQKAASNVNSPFSPSFKAADANPRQKGVMSVQGFHLPPQSGVDTCADLTVTVRDIFVTRTSGSSTWSESRPPLVQESFAVLWRLGWSMRSF